MANAHKQAIGKIKVLESFSYTFNKELWQILNNVHRVRIVSMFKYNNLLPLAKNQILRHKCITLYENFYNLKT